MPQAFRELRERLLRAGIAPRHVSRYLRELADHLADLKVEEMREGCTAAEAESAALLRLGDTNSLAAAMIERRQLQSWSARAPWAVFGIGPLLFLAIAWSTALFLLWSGWNIFLPNSESPFVPIYGNAVIYFGFARLIFFGAPVLIGWGIALVAIRQRLPAVWPTIALAVITLLEGTTVVHTRNMRVAVNGAVLIPEHSKHVSLGFNLSSAVQGGPFGLFHLVLFLTLALMPYLLWRLRRTPAVTA